MSTNPAKILGINAGTLSVGSPADIALVDLNEEWTVDIDKLHGKSKNTPFKGKTLTGKVKTTILNGKVVFTD
jgi:dihydroorotase